MWQIDSICCGCIVLPSELKGILPGTAEAKSLKWLPGRAILLFIIRAFLHLAWENMSLVFYKLSLKASVCIQGCSLGSIAQTAPGKPSVVRRLQKIVLAGCRVCIRAYVGCIPVGGKHWGCKGIQLFGRLHTTLCSCLTKGNSVDMQRSIGSEIWKPLLWSWFSACWNQHTGFHLISSSLPQPLTPRSGAEAMLLWHSRCPTNLTIYFLSTSFWVWDQIITQLYKILVAMTNWPSNP